MSVPISGSIADDGRADAQLGRPRGRLGLVRPIDAQQLGALARHAHDVPMPVHRRHVVGVGDAAVQWRELDAARLPTPAPARPTRRRRRSIPSSHGHGVAPGNVVAMTDCVLAIDLGTGGPKVALVERGGAHARVAQPRRCTPRSCPTAAPSRIPARCGRPSSLRRTTTLAAVRPLPPIVAVAVTSQYMSTIPVAADGTPTGPCILWMDTRGAAHNLTLLNDDSFMLFLERHGLIPLPSGNDNVAHAHVVQHVPPRGVRGRGRARRADGLPHRRGSSVGSPPRSRRCSGNSCATTAPGVPPSTTPSWSPPPGSTRRSWHRSSPMNGVVGEVDHGRGRRAGHRPRHAGGAGHHRLHHLGRRHRRARAPTSGSVIIGTTSVMVSHLHEHRGDLTLGHSQRAQPGAAALLRDGRERARRPSVRLGTAIARLRQRRHRLGRRGTVAPGSDGVLFLPWLLGSIAPSPNDDVRAAFVGLVPASRAPARHPCHARRCRAEPRLARAATSRRSSATRSPSSASAVVARRARCGRRSSPTPPTGPCTAWPSRRATNARGAAFLAFADLDVISLDDVPSLLQVQQEHDTEPVHRAVMDRSLARLIALHPAHALY